MDTVDDGVGRNRGIYLFIYLYIHIEVDIDIHIRCIDFCMYRFIHMFT
jgi:hypothetical protein